MKGEAEEREEALEGIPGGVTPQGSAQSKKKKKKSPRLQECEILFTFLSFPFVPFH